MRKFTSIMAATALSLAATSAYSGGHAQSWTLDPELSNVSFGSIKNDYVGESHSFADVSGKVNDYGDVSIDLNLGSVETLIDIRNERMVEYVFKNAPTATITAKIDMATLHDMPVGESTVVETSGTLNLLGTENELDATFFVMRLSDDQVMVASNGMLMLSTEDAGIDAGIDALQEIASLDSITRVSPVSLRLIFNADK